MSGFNSPRAMLKEVKGFKRYRYIGLGILFLGWGLFREPNFESQKLGHLLPGLEKLVEQLEARQEQKAAYLGYGILIPLTGAPGLREELQNRQGRLPEPLNGAETYRGEKRLAEEMQRLDRNERLFLWSVTLEPLLSSGVRSQILRLLDSSSGTSAPLEEVLRRGEGAVSWEAAVLLGRKGRGVEALREAVRKGRGWGRQYAVMGLAMQGASSGLAEIRSAHNDASPAVRRHVALALGKLGDPSDRALLDQIAKRLPDPATLKAVLHAKARIHARFPEPS